MIETELNVQLLKDHALFAGFSTEELQELMCILKGKSFRFQKGDNLNQSMDTLYPDTFFYLLDGYLLIKKSDDHGNQMILDFARHDSLLGYYGILTRTSFEEQDITAAAPGQILSFDPAPLRPLLGQNPLLARLEKNMVPLLAHHSWQLMKKVEILSCHTLRGKVLSFLSAQREYFQSDTFELPMDRKTLADYLYVNSSALSRELGNLKREGLIDYHRSRFSLHFPDKSPY